MCGESVPPRAQACPDCGADHRSGWRLDALEQETDDEFDYEDFAAREFGSPASRPKGLSLLWWVTAAGLFLLFAAALLRTLG